MIDQMRRGIARLIALDAADGVIQRKDTTHTVICRVSYQNGGVWDYTTGDTGATITTTPYVLADPQEDIRERDILVWRDRRFQVGAVSFPTLDGGKTCLQAQLREVKQA